MALQFYNLKIATVRFDTDAAVQIGFRIPDKIKEAFTFDPGQYLTISLTVDGEKVRRAYSICSATHEPIITILLKRVDNGLVSNYLNDNVKVGQKMDVLPPNGHFKLVIDEKKQHHYYFFGAGSGITPLISMIASVLEKEPLSHCHLLYGSRDEDNILFNKKLERLVLVYKKRFSMQLILSRPKAQSSTKTTTQIGRINIESISSFLKEVNMAQPDGYFICGPGPMIESTYQSLLALDIDKDLVHKEYFQRQ